MAVPKDFQSLLLALQNYWAERGCALMQGYDLEVGAGTMNPATFLRVLGITSDDHDLRFVEDDWESPTLGAWGLGWEVWCDGMEVTQFTYFQQAGGFECRPVAAELTYGLERIAMYLQGVDNIYDLVFCTYPDGTRLTYRDVFWQNEREQSEYSFHASDPDMLLRLFDEHESERRRLFEKKLP